MWRTRQRYKEKVSLAPRDMNGLGVGSSTTLTTMEKYIDYQYYLRSDLHLKGENDGGNFHILRYGEVFLAYTLF